MGSDIVEADTASKNNTCIPEIPPLGVDGDISEFDISYLSSTSSQPLPHWVTVLPELLRSRGQNRLRYFRP